LLTTVAFLYMMRDGVCSLWVVALILAREFAVSGVRMLAASSNTVIAASMWGKVKTVLQMLTILFYFIAAALAGATDVTAVSLISNILCWLVTLATVVSGGIYLWQNRSCFIQAKWSLRPGASASGRFCWPNVKMRQKNQQFFKT